MKRSWSGRSGGAVAVKASAVPPALPPPTPSSFAVDDVVIVDWSASASPKLGADSIWISHVETGSLTVKALVNLSTRAEAVAWLADCFADNKDRGRHLLCGLDFSFGYPTGYAQLLTEVDAFRPARTGWEAPWETVHAITSDLLVDGKKNENNRFDLADRINAETKAALFWGHPVGRSYDSLSRTKLQPPQHLQPNPLESLRITDRLSGAAVFSNWQLLGAGAVGSQVLTGLPVIHKLRAEPVKPTVWPFQPHNLNQPGARVVLAEIWPPMHAHKIVGLSVKDAWQVQSCALHFAALTEEEWGDVLEPKSWAERLSGEERARVMEEEGWILGVK